MTYQEEDPQLDELEDKFCHTLMLPDDEKTESQLAMERYVNIIKAKREKAQQISLEQLPLAMNLLMF